MTGSVHNRRIADLSIARPPEIAEPDCRPASDMRRLNLNESLLPPSPHALAAMAEALQQAQAYTDHGCSALAVLLSERTGLPANRISFGNGSGELLTMAAAIALEPGDEAIFPAPTFPTCAKGVAVSGGRLVEVPVRADGANDIPAMLAALTDKTRLFYVCTPNNPTGAAIGEDDLIAAIEGVPAGCLLVVDEAYHEFAAAEGYPDVLSLLDKRSGPWVVTRTFSKAYCMAGLRVGYAFTSDTELRNAFWKLRGNFNVNRIGLAGAVAAMKDEAYLQETLSSLLTQRKRLAAGLEEMGFENLPSQANFLTSLSPEPASGLADGLAGRGLLVQAMPWPGGNGSLRITIGEARDVDELLGGLADLLRGSAH